jgi:ribosomal protein S18 acetylase RimI-like enzyme
MKLFKKLVTLLLGFTLFNDLTLVGMEKGNITDFNYERDNNEVLRLFEANWESLVASRPGEYEQACTLDEIDTMFKTLSPDQDPQYTGVLQVKVIRQDEHLCGFIAYYPYKEQEQDKGYILYLVVDAAYRGQGYAERLLRHACDHLSNRYMVDAIRLLSRPDNQQARAFYEKFGFVQQQEYCEPFVYFEYKKPYTLNIAEVVVYHK